MMRFRTGFMMLVVSGLFAGSALAQQGVFVVDGQAIGLLAQTKVQKDLKLDEGQVKKAAEASAKATAKLIEVGKKAREAEKATKGAGAEILRDSRPNIAVAYKKEIASFLKAEQLKQLRSITIKMTHWQVFNDPDLRDELKLTVEQRAKVKAILKNMQTEMLAISRAMSLPKAAQTDVAMRAKELNDRTLGEIVAILDDAQKKQWREMQDEPLK